MLGHDAARIHAALNDLPAALLVAAVVFDLLGAFLKRDSLKTAGFWTLVAGVLGGIAAAISGLIAKEAAPLGTEAHGVAETHGTLAFIVLGLFALLALWRVVRRGVWSDKEQPVALTAAVIGVALMTFTAMLGGRLVFDHGVGIPTATLEAAALQRAALSGENQPQAAPAAPLPADSTTPAPVPADSEPPPR